MKLLRPMRLLLASACLVAGIAWDGVRLDAQNSGSEVVPVVVDRKEPRLPGQHRQLGDFIVLIRATVAADGSVVAAVPDGQYPPAFKGQVQLAAEAVRSWRFRPRSGSDLTTLVGINFARPPSWELVDEWVPVGGKVKPPRAVTTIPALSPSDVIPAGNQPGVVAELTIDDSGIPMDAVALEPITALTAPALDAALRWRFKPDSKVPRKRVKVSVPFVVPASFGLPRAQWPATPHFTGGRQENGVVAPRAVRQPKPFYTAEAMKKKQQGSVIVEALVDVDGSVVAARVVRSLPLLDRSALECIRQWTFTPALANGKPTPAVVQVDLNFALR